MRDCEELPLTGDAFERVASPVDELDARARGQVAQGRGDQNFAGAGLRRDARPT
jgi:hypothetical protein